MTHDPQHIHFTYFNMQKISNTWNRKLKATQLYVKITIQTQKLDTQNILKHTWRIETGLKKKEEKHLVVQFCFPGLQNIDKNNFLLKRNSNSFSTFSIYFLIDH